MNAANRIKVSKALIPVILGWVELATFTDAKRLKNKHQGHKVIASITLPWDKDKQIAVKVLSVDTVSFTVVVEGMAYVDRTEICLNVMNEEVLFNEAYEALRRRSEGYLDVLHHLAKETPELLPELTFEVTDRHFTVMHKTIQDIGLAFPINKKREF